MLKTEVLFTDTETQTWGKLTVLLSEIIAVSEAVNEEGKILSDVSQITIRSIGSYTIKEPYEKILAAWVKSKQTPYISWN